MTHRERARAACPTRQTVKLPALAAHTFHAPDCGACDRIEAAITAAVEEAIERCEEAVAAIFYRPGYKTETEARAAIRALKGTP